MLVLNTFILQKLYPCRNLNLSRFDLSDSAVCVANEALKVLSETYSLSDIFAAKMYVDTIINSLNSEATSSSRDAFNRLKSAGLWMLFRRFIGLAKLR